MFMSVVASTFLSLWLHFGIKNGPESTRRASKTTIEISIDFPIIFWTILAPFWDPFWSSLGHFGLQNGTIWELFSPPPKKKNTPKVAQCPSKAPKMTSKSDKMTPRTSPQGPHFGAFWLILGAFLRVSWWRGGLVWGQNLLQETLKTRLQ